MMKPISICAALACVSLFCGPRFSNAVAASKAANTSARHAQALHFARGATQLSARGQLGRSANRFYTLKMNAGQHLSIKAVGLDKVVPLIFVTPPCGKYNGDKTNVYNEDSSRAGIYQIEVATNQMASQGINGEFKLSVEAY